MVPKKLLKNISFSKRIKWRYVEMCNIVYRIPSARASQSGLLPGMAEVRRVRVLSTAGVMILTNTALHKLYDITLNAAQGDLHCVFSKRAFRPVSRVLS